MITALYRGYGYPNEELIERAIIFAKRVVLDYYESKSSGYPSEIRAYVDKERATVHKEMNDALDFFKDKKNIGKVMDIEIWNSLNDILMSAVVLFHTYLVEQSGELESEELDRELNNVEKILEENEPNPDSNYQKYVKLYDEIVNVLKLSDTLPEDEETEERTDH